MNKPLLRSMMQRQADLSAVTQQIIGAARISALKLQNFNLAAGTAEFAYNGKIYAAERVGQFWFLTGDYTEA